MISQVSVEKTKNIFIALFFLPILMMCSCNTSTKFSQWEGSKTLKGDGGDGVPNFLSPDDTFVNGIRQKPISKKKLDYWIDSDPKGFCNEYQYRNFQRNQRLVDFDYIPKEIEESILSEFDSVETAGRHKILNYFVKNKLNDLIGQIQEF